MGLFEELMLQQDAQQKPLEYRPQPPVAPRAGISPSGIHPPSPGSSWTERSDVLNALPPGAQEQYGSFTPYDPRIDDELGLESPTRMMRPELRRPSLQGGLGPFPLSMPGMSDVKSIVDILKESGLAGVDTPGSKEWVERKTKEWRGEDAQAAVAEATKGATPNQQRIAQASVADQVAQRRAADQMVAWLDEQKKLEDRAEDAAMERDKRIALGMVTQAIGGKSLPTTAQFLPGSTIQSNQVDIAGPLMQKAGDFDDLSKGAELASSMRELGIDLPPGEYRYSTLSKVAPMAADLKKFNLELDISRIARDAKHDQHIRETLQKFWDNKENVKQQDALEEAADIEALVHDPQFLESSQFIQRVIRKLLTASGEGGRLSDFDVESMARSKLGFKGTWEGFSSWILSQKPESYREQILRMMQDIRKHASSRLTRNALRYADIHAYGINGIPRELMLHHTLPAENIQLPVTVKASNGVKTFSLTPGELREYQIRNPGVKFEISDEDLEKYSHLDLNNAP